jgi:glycosyltransferase involved in cell wall biosynthesis
MKAMDSQAISHPTDEDVVLLIPEDDEPAPQLSIVVPALNEELTIVDFVAWCRQGLAEAGVTGEILIIDSSTDDTPQLALSHGARVLRIPKRGLGRAYIDAIPFIRGEWVLMGDADCTYDFRQLSSFVDGFRSGHQFVMGSRWKGSIEPGSMPALHRYFGTPFTTWILNRLYSSRFSDIHCGMRGLTRDALERMQLDSQSWEYASEMVLKSVHMGLRTVEVPVRFLKDREGRVSHHKRLGWFSPFQAAWINLRAMFVYGADFFLVKPGLLLVALGLLLTVPLSFGPRTVGPLTFSLYWMLLGLTLTVLGVTSTYLGLLARTFYDATGARLRAELTRFRYTRAAAVSAVLWLVGLALGAPLIITYLSDGLRLKPGIEPLNHLAVTGLMVSVIGFVTFTFTLVLHASALPRWRHDG